MEVDQQTCLLQSLPDLSINIKFWRHPLKSRNRLDSSSIFVVEDYHLHSGRLDTTSLDIEVDLEFFAALDDKYSDDDFDLFSPAIGVGEGVCATGDAILGDDDEDVTPIHTMHGPRSNVKHVPRGQ
ncbi:hypothetical protein ACJX0J_013001, partial [Zea mays]